MTCRPQKQLSKQADSTEKIIHRNEIKETWVSYYRRNNSVWAAKGKQKPKQRSLKNIVEVYQAPDNKQITSVHLSWEDKPGTLWCGSSQSWFCITIIGELLETGEETPLFREVRFPGVSLRSLLTLKTSSQVCKHIYAHMHTCTHVHTYTGNNKQRYPSHSYITSSQVCEHIFRHMHTHTGNYKQRYPNHSYIWNWLSHRIRSKNYRHYL